MTAWAVPGTAGAAGDPVGWPARSARAVRAAAGAVPPPSLVLLSIASVQSGAALAKTLFAAVPPPAVVLLRLGIGALVLLAGRRFTRRTRSPAVAGPPAGPAGLAGTRWRDAAVAGALGLTLAGMNLSFYEALARIPLGVAVTVEFCGPLAVAVLGSRRWRDAVWVLLAGVGVLLLTRGGGAVTPVGVLLAGLAGVGWAGYILLTAAVGRRFDGTDGLTLACSVGALVILPAGVLDAGDQVVSVRTLLFGAGVALLSAVIPYSLELAALRRIPARVFGLLMSLEPAVAALVGFVALGEVLSGREWLAVGLVILACVGATRTAAAR